MTTPGDDGFNPTIHAPNRLRICAILDAVDEAEFAMVQQRLNVSASVLSKHISALVEAGYVRQKRAVRDTRQRVWLQMTRAGRAAYQAHLHALRNIVGDAV